MIHKNIIISKIKLREIQFLNNSNYSKIEDSQYNNNNKIEEHQFNN